MNNKKTFRPGTLLNRDSDTGRFPIEIGNISY